jgi:hypothetical protein
LPQVDLANGSKVAALGQVLLELIEAAAPTMVVLVAFDHIRRLAVDKMASLKCG